MIWWAWVLVGLAVAGALAAIIVTAYKSGRTRGEADEKSASDGARAALTSTQIQRLEEYEARVAELYGRGLSAHDRVLGLAGLIRQYGDIAHLARLPDPPE